MSMRTRTGKVARLPLAIREELNRRLLENEPAKRICAWLNALPEAISVCDEFGEQPIDAGNISEWRKGGYADWLARRERIEHTRELATFASKLAQANGSTISEGAAAIASGRILELLEAVETDLNPEDLAELINGVTALRAEDTKHGRLELGRARLKQMDEQLALEKAKFQRQTCELFLKWHEDQRAVAAANGAGDNSEKIERLGQLMFGQDWEPPKDHLAVGP
jgi:hypothetical protein